MESQDSWTEGVGDKPTVKGRASPHRAPRARVKDLDLSLNVLESPGSLRKKLFHYFTYC